MRKALEILGNKFGRSNESSPESFWKLSLVSLQGRHVRAGDIKNFLWVGKETSPSSGSRGRRNADRWTRKTRILRNIADLKGGLKREDYG